MAHEYDAEWTAEMSEALRVESHLNFTSQEGQDERLSPELFKYIEQLGLVGVFSLIAAHPCSTVTCM